MSPGRIIRKQLKVMENEIGLLESLRDEAKTEGGRMTQFGRELIALAKAKGLKQSLVAKLLDITPGAVSHHYNR